MKLQYNINRDILTAKMSALSTGKIDKYEFFTGEETIPSDQSRIIEQAKFLYSLLGKAFEKQIKTIEDQWTSRALNIEDQGIKQVETLKTLKLNESKQDIKQIDRIFPKEMRTNENKNETDEIKNGKKK